MSASIELGKCFFKAVESGDIDAIRDMYHPDAVIWHNIDGLDKRDKGQSREESIEVLSMLTSVISNWHYDVWYREATESGFVQQHILRGTLPNGEALALPVCLVCKIENNKIVRIDEHLDSAITDRLTKVLMASI